MNNKKLFVILCFVPVLFLAGCKNPLSPNVEVKTTPAPVAEKAAEPAPIPPVVIPPAPETPSAPEENIPSVTVTPLAPTADVPPVTVTPPAPGSDTPPAKKTIEPVIEKPELVLTVPANKVEIFKPVPFDVCGLTSRFKNYAWFKDLDSILAQSGLSPDGPLKSSDILQICFSTQGNLALLMQGGGYCKDGSIFRFDTKQKVIDRAVFLDNTTQCSRTFTGFGSRVGGIIHVSAGFGDAGCVFKYGYDYDFIANTLKLTRSCSRCTNEKETCK